ncbi:TetR family transcriptional regulator [Streptomyces sp. WAC 06738]|uniref:TetR/AcrR family transcriptional regulator n=1 Tax=Streptomyces sp. WAC 06738 TaxID=2203210 RepID=UPI000F70ED62|nr:TetR/AcrR family transcriptional regulator [Streptomyces sp. WAC 06738]AZM48828.1 TetR family transcriptional regulator [Streptomyces sp. WAC 06738]
MAEGLRERKKRQTRQLISDVATGLFLERGFDAVTVAEVAEAADVSVNTVYNYFPAKEDLFLDRSRGVTERLSRDVRGRAAGESAAEAVLRGLREDVEAVSARVGLNPGIGKFMVVVQGADGLKARLWLMQQEALLHLAATLREETGASADDPLPDLIAGQLSWVNNTLYALIRREMTAGRDPAAVSRDALGLLDEMEELLGEKVLNYARRTGD